MTNRSPHLALAALALIAFAACAKKDEPKSGESSVAVAPPPPLVTQIELGKHLGTNLRVAENLVLFAPADTLYLSIVTENAVPDTRLATRWTDASGKMIDSSVKEVARQSGTTTAVTAFHLVKLSGWPVGKYKVEVWLNNQSVGVREIDVK